MEHFTGNIQGVSRVKLSLSMSTVLMWRFEPSRGCDTDCERNEVLTFSFQLNMNSRQRIHMSTYDLSQTLSGKEIQISLLQCIKDKIIVRTEKHVVFEIELKFIGYSSCNSSAFYLYRATSRVFP